MNDSSRNNALARASLVLVSCLLISLGCNAQEQDEPRNRFIEVGPGLYFNQDRLASNSTVLITDEGVLVVDARMHPKDGRALIEEIRRHTDQPIKWVVNGQFHGDHYLGNVAFKAEGATIVAHEATARVIREKYAHEIERRTPTFERYGYDPAEVELVEPDVTFTDRMTIELGGKSVELIYIGDGQNEGDTVVVFPDYRAAYPSGSLVRQSWSNTSYTPSMQGWIDTLQKIKALDVDVFLPGHGSMITQRADIDEEIEFLELLRSDVRQAIEDGLSAEETAAKLSYENYQHYRNYRQRERNIKSLYHLEKTGRSAYFDD